MSVRSMLIAGLAVLLLPLSSLAGSAQSSESSPERYAARMRVAQAAGTKQGGRPSPQTPTHTLNAINDYIAGIDYCGAPYKTICESAAYNPSGRAQRVDALRTKLRRKALEDTAKWLGRDPRTFTEADIAAMQPDTERERVAKYYVQRVAQWYDFEVGLTELMAMWGNIGKIKGYLKAAIDARLAPLGPDRQALAAELKLAIDLTIPIDRRGLNAMLEQGDPDAPYLARAFLQACGPDGLADNAFAYRPREIRYLVVCPGLLMGVPAAGDIATADFRNVVQALGHELAHHIDAGNYPALYADYRSCLATHHAGGLGGPAEGDPAVTRVDPHLREITADYWATQAILLYLKTDGRALAARDRNQVLRESFGALCGSREDGVHPSGRFRIDVLLRGDPDLCGVMGCQPAVGGAPGCGLGGAAPR